MNRRQLLTGFIATASGILVPEPRRVYSFVGGWSKRYIWVDRTPPWAWHLGHRFIRVEAAEDIPAGAHVSIDSMRNVAFLDWSPTLADGLSWGDGQSPLRAEWNNEQVQRALRIKRERHGSRVWIPT